MFDYLQVPERTDRWRVIAAELLLSLVTSPGRLFPRSPLSDPPYRRILLLRLERIGDLLMSLGAIDAVRRLAPDAVIDLVVGSWNKDIAALIPQLNHVDAIDAPWLARESRGGTGFQLAGTALGWRRRTYDLGINFEGDIRSNVLLGLAGCRRTVGFHLSGGAPVLTDRVDYDPRRHVAANCLALVERAFNRPAGSLTKRWQIVPPLAIPESARARGVELLGTCRGSNGRSRGSTPLVGMHVSGGREIKQWDPDRFAQLATRLGQERGAVIVFTGAPTDRALVDRVLSGLSPTVSSIDLTGRLDLVTLAAVLGDLDLFVTADTGPMHLAATIGTPLVALFGPSDPARWGPLSTGARVLRHDLPCSPCNRIRRPPQRCVGHVPDCLAAIDVDRVYEAAVAMIDRGRT